MKYLLSAASILYCQSIRWEMKTPAIVVWNPHFLSLYTYRGNIIISTSIWHEKYVIAFATIAMKMPHSVVSFYAHSHFVWIYPQSSWKLLKRDFFRTYVPSRCKQFYLFFCLCVSTIWRFFRGLLSISISSWYQIFLMTTFKFLLMAVKIFFLKQNCWFPFLTT